MKMAKASDDEIQRAIDLANLLESVCDPRNFVGRRWPDTEEEAGGFFDEESPEDLREFFDRVRKLCPGLFRVTFGYQVLVSNCCDPDKDTLEWKPGIIVPEPEEEAATA